MKAAPDLLAAYLQRTGISQRQLAKALGVTRAAVQHWLRGSSTPGLEYVVKLHQMARIPPESWLIEKND